MKCYVVVRAHPGCEKTARIPKKAILHRTREAALVEAEEIVKGWRRDGLDVTPLDDGVWALSSPKNPWRIQKILVREHVVPEPDLVKGGSADGA